MAKNSIRDYSATNSSNTDIQSIDISEGCSPAGINNAIREVMADLKDVSTGAVALESPAFDSASLTGDLTFGDNDKAIFGAGSDLQIYHNGFASAITDAGSGDLFLGGDNNVLITNAALNETKAKFISNAGVALYYDNNQKFVTTSTGVDVTGGLNTTGNVGIGTSSPATLLHLESDTPTITLRDTSAYSAGTGPYIQFQGLDSGSTNRVFGQIYGLSNGSNSGELAFYTRNSGSTAERMRLDSSGNLLVGTTSTGQFKISGASGIANADIGHVNGTASGYGYAIFRYNDTIIGRIDQNGTTGVSYVTSSDYRLKTAVNYDWDATTRLKQLRPARFEWIADGDDAVPVDGFLAHEVQDIVPEAISGTKDGMRDEEYQVSAATGDIYTPATEAVLDEDGNEVTPAVAEVIHSTDVERPEELAEGQQWRETTAAVMGTRSVPDYQGIDQSKLTPLLTKALIEAVEKIEQLEARITALEAN